MTKIWRTSSLVTLVLVTLPTEPVRAQTGSLQNPSEPQKFEIATGESAGFGFVVSQPGPIVIRAQWQGVPLIVSLSPLAQPIEKSGSGSVDLSYTVSADDVRRGVVWKVSLRSASAPLRPVSSASVLIDSHNAVTLLRVAKTEAQGTVTIQHPPGDMQQAEQQLKALAGDRHAAAQQQLSQIRDQLHQAVQARQAQLQKAMSDQQATRLQQLKAQAAQSSARPGKIAGPQLQAKSSDVAMSPMAMSKEGLAPKQTTGTSQSKDIGAAGSNPPQTVAKPTITSLSVSEGQPGDPVLINGSGFGSSPGEVHFIVNPGMDLKASADYWSDAQVVATVPSAEKILSYGGYVYVQRGTDKSGVVSFKFNPALQLMTLGITADKRIKSPYDTTGIGAFCGCIAHEGAGDLFGHKDDDEFFSNTTLKNGWVVDSVNFGIHGSIFGNANASVSDSRIGTNSPYVKVHWWMDTFSSVDYNVSVNIKGPTGVPYQ